MTCGTSSCVWLFALGAGRVDAGVLEPALDLVGGARARTPSVVGLRGDPAEDEHEHDDRDRQEQEESDPRAPPRPTRWRASQRTIGERHDATMNAAITGIVISDVAPTSQMSPTSSRARRRGTTPRARGRAASAARRRPWRAGRAARRRAGRPGRLLVTLPASEEPLSSLCVALRNLTHLSCRLPRHTRPLPDGRSAPCTARARASGRASSSHEDDGAASPLGSSGRASRGRDRARDAACPRPVPSGRRARRPTAASRSRMLVSPAPGTAVAGESRRRRRAPRSGARRRRR